VGTRIVEVEEEMTRPLFREEEQEREVMGTRLEEQEVQKVMYRDEV
jgi:hypothetical protein